MRWLWIAAAVLLLVAAASVWFAFQRPDFVAGLVAAAAAALWKALAPGILKLLKPASAEELARRKKLRDLGEEDAPSARPFGRGKE